ncbi:Small RNA 2'-O-methyltransferase [Quillaja saponaria]|uniref:Small RNA 2'-O-methyltransferase n=1 Tax=Quillaja saponaria TaxID=32244 RepID=A0AAD7PV99_QUISA|nr:Small RNA 2'-O-methyltransferase [Quillaja saponaria]
MCYHGNVTASSKQLEDLGGSFTCVIKLLSKCQTLLIECSPKDSYKKQADAIQSASLKLILWLNMYFKDLNMTLENLNHYADVNNIQIYSTNFFKEFALCQILHDNQCNSSQGSKLLESICVNTSYSMPGYEVCSLKIEGPDSGVWTCSGSLTCISYSVSLVTKDERMKVLLEGQEEFEFEVGVGALISHIEAIVMQMSVGQSACFNTNIPAPELLLASASDSARTLSLLSSEACYLEYFIILSRVTEPLEDRMEKALFSPPLSKQRVEYAVQHIRESHATSLVDFGCGSGSLLDSLLNYQTSLETIIGVDISQKSLSRAAKVLHSKLGMNLDADVPYRGIKSVVLYDGSITTFDSRLSGFDIGTCLEVIEHMEEDQACLFGDVVLNSFCPRILIVSTPNYEYNVILQGSNPPTQEEELDEKTQLVSCKFRNNDHKFEWTREQFNRWATDLASRHNYSVEFSGVGGSADQEPGFASQIAVFRRRATPDTDAFLKNTDTEHHYKVIWEWNSNMAAAS